jgi:hypothetical protein
MVTNVILVQIYLYKKFRRHKHSRSATKSVGGGEAFGEEADALSHGVRWRPAASILSAPGLRFGQRISHRVRIEVRPFPWWSMWISSSPAPTMRREDSLQAAGARPLQAEERGL